MCVNFSKTDLNSVATYLQIPENLEKNVSGNKV